ncbi:polypeptide N-acetylgalactosaminyltransferase 5 [Spea bombifrons]|uniref:polypeptide N-acetylgalactosaminyltransferase 5 n=1 Tax=Spea bombifrons TaxID=233779 RepID=UPI0023498938|nr:polypeptide N-acetylgalactosaminyltransferase 5 [Spea bombifrons]
MHRVRKYFRGSGRALAFIFIASVIWLIFDMAALRFSFNEINGKLMKEELFRREKEGFAPWKSPGRNSVDRVWLKGDTTKLKGVFHPPTDPVRLDLGQAVNRDFIIAKQRKRTIKPLQVFNRTVLPIGRPTAAKSPDLHSWEQGKDMLGDKRGKFQNPLQTDALHRAVVRVSSATSVPVRAGVQNVEKPAGDLKVAGKSNGVGNSDGIGEFKGTGDPNILKVIGEPQVGVNRTGTGESQDAENIKVVEESNAAGDGETYRESKINGENKAIVVFKAGEVKKDSRENKDEGNKGDAGEQKDGGRKDAGEKKGEGDRKDIGVQKVDGDRKDAGEQKDEGYRKDTGEKKAQEDRKDSGKQRAEENKKAGEHNFEGDRKDAGEEKAEGDKKEAGEQKIELGRNDAGKQEAKELIKVQDQQKAEGGIKNTGDQKAEGDKKEAGGPKAENVMEISKGLQENLPGKDTRVLQKINETLKETVIVIDKVNATSPLTHNLRAANANKSTSNDDVPLNGNLDKVSVNGARNVTDKKPATPNSLKLPITPVVDNRNVKVTNKKLHFKEGFLGKVDEKGDRMRQNQRKNTTGTKNKFPAKEKNFNQVAMARSSGKHKVLTLDRTMAPRDLRAPGQFGRPLKVPKDKEAEANRRWKEGNFNVYLSDLIPLDRAIEDTRPNGCSEKLVHDDLPTTSIIMCFVDEVWSTLIRSVFSVLNRSPDHLVKEIILVDDFSTKAYLKDNLDKFVLKFPKVKILHLGERHGLIRARIAGANIATGDVLTFLDSHVECNVGWLEPLLEQVRLNRKKVACPVIEVISDKDMSYMTVDNFQRGIFSWPMNFGWKPIPPEVLKKNKITEIDPIRCPVMAGGLFSIDKKYFYELGTYDPGLDVWGGENMELSFKVWMCGGEIEIIPCSRVGHIFRNDNPYSFPKDRIKTVERNLARVAEVWLDEYKELFYGHGYHLLQQNLNIGDLTEQRALREKLQCKSFKWYIDHVYPDLDAPVIRATGVLMNKELGKCLSLQNSTFLLDPCDASKQNQRFNYTWLRLLKQNDLCLAPSNQKDKVSLHPCNNTDSNLRWLHKSLTSFQPPLKEHFLLENIQHPTCLDVDQSHRSIKLSTCEPSNKHQKWQFEKYFVE